MIRVIHLSDLHIHKRRSDPDNRGAETLVAHLTKRFKGYKQGDTFVLLTGDLTDNGALRQYKMLKTHVLDPLAEHFTLLPAPGNHDYAWLGNLLDRAAPPRFAKYVRQSHQMPSGANAYPCHTVHPIDRIVFIGLDSADPCGKVGCATGIVDKVQRDALKEVLKAPAHRNRLKLVYLHHHPFDRGLAVKLHEVDELFSVLSRHADLVLFGHKHKHEAFFGWCHVELMLASGKVTEATGGNALMYRVLEIDKGTLKHVYSEEGACA
jgi:3',5'-cyclic AMP phosphodiesterase CpdA